MVSLVTLHGMCMELFRKSKLEIEKDFLRGTQLGELEIGIWDFKQERKTYWKMAFGILGRLGLLENSRISIMAIELELSVGLFLDWDWQDFFSKDRRL